MNWLWSWTLCKIGIHRNIVAKIDVPYVYFNCQCCGGNRSWNRFSQIRSGDPDVDQKWINTGVWSNVPQNLSRRNNL